MLCYMYYMLLFTIIILIYSFVCAVLICVSIWLSVKVRITIRSCSMLVVHEWICVLNESFMWMIILTLHHNFNSLKFLPYEVHDCFDGFSCLHRLTIAQAGSIEERPVQGAFHWLWIWTNLCFWICESEWIVLNDYKYAHCCIRYYYYYFLLFQTWMMNRNLRLWTTWRNLKLLKNKHCEAEKKKAKT